MRDPNQKRLQRFTGTLADPCWGCGKIATTFNAGWPVCSHCKAWNVGEDAEAWEKMRAAEGADESRRGEL